MQRLFLNKRKALKKTKGYKLMKKKLNKSWDFLQQKKSLDASLIFSPIIDAFISKIRRELYHHCDLNKFVLYVQSFLIRTWYNSMI